MELSVQMSFVAPPPEVPHLVPLQCAQRGAVADRDYLTPRKEMENKVAITYCIYRLHSLHVFNIVTITFQKEKVIKQQSPIIYGLHLTSFR
jgi:hypothetical protein